MNKEKTNLSERMQAVFDMVEPCDTAADIGCDHGFVSIALVKEGIAKKVLACDVNEGPIKAATQNVRQAGLSDSIETRLSDGLHKIKTDDCVDTLIIAGMGGRLMIKILSEGEEILKNVRQLVLQPQSELFLVRKYIRDIGFYIEKEKFLKDEGKFYWVMDIRKGETQKEVSEIDDLFSGYLIAGRDPLLKEYLEGSISMNESYLANIAPEKQGELIRKTEQLKQALLLMQ